MFFSRAQSRGDQPFLWSKSGGQWQSITSRAWEGAALADLLAEADHLSGREAGGRLWLCDLTGKAVPPTAPSWRLERLSNGAAGAASLAGWGTT